MRQEIYLEYIFIYYCYITKTKNALTYAIKLMRLLITNYKRKL